MNDHDVTLAHSWAAGALVDALRSTSHGLSPMEVKAVEALVQDLDEDWVF